MSPPFSWRYRTLRFGAPIVVVSGLPRSGTSMVMGMLAAGGMEIVTDGLRVADEHNPRGYFECARVKTLGADRDTSWLTSARGKAIKVVSFLLPHLPATLNYRVVFVHRDMEEVLTSQNKMLGEHGVRDPAADRRLANAYDVHLESVTVMLRSRPWFDVLDLQHRDVLEYPGEQAARISQFVGRQLDVARMAGAVSGALYRTRR